MWFDVFQIKIKKSTTHRDEFVDQYAEKIEQQMQQKIKLLLFEWKANIYTTNKNVQAKMKRHGFQKMSNTILFHFTFYSARRMDAFQKCSRSKSGDSKSKSGGQV